MPITRQSVVARIAHHYPLLSGCGTFANSRLVRMLAGQGQDETAWAMHHNGMRMRVRLDDFNGRAVFYVGDVDRKLSWLCSRLVRPGDTVVDVGANIGLVTLTLAGLVGTQGRVFSFDPNPSLVALLRESLAANDIRQVTLQQCAVGECDSELTLSVPRGHSGRGSLVRTKPGREYEEISVPVRPLSSLIPNDVSHIRLMKIDVEGFESQVLAGAKELFLRATPDVVLFELNQLDGHVSDEPSVRLLREYGYEFMSIPKTLFRMKVQRFDPDHDAMVGHDLVACRAGDVARDIASALRIGKSS